MNSWRWVVVDDPKLVAAAAEIYNGGLEDFIASLGDATGANYRGATIPGADRISTSVQHLRDNFHRCPALLVPLKAGRCEDLDAFSQASQWGSIIQAVWSFFLALRARGLGSAWATGHMWRERQLAELLDIPYQDYTQVGLFPIAYTIGTEFRPAYRKPVDEVVGWNQFEPSAP
jgi:nitroreductase